MLPNHKWLYFNDAILSTKFHPKTQHLSVLDRTRTLFNIDTTSFEILKSKNLYNKNLSDFDYYRHAGLIYDEKHLFLWPSDSSVGFYTKTLPVTTPLYHFKQHQAPITAIDFSHDGTLLVSGDEKGRSAICNLEYGTVESTLPPMPDMITVTTFSDSSELVTCTSYNGTINTYNSYTGSLTSSMQVDSVVESLKYLDEDTAIVLLKDARVLHIDLLEGKILKENYIIGNIWPTTMELSSSKKFVYIGTRESKLYVLHVNSLENMCDVEFKNGGITRIEHTKKLLFVGFSSGELLVIRHREYSDAFEKEVIIGNLDEAIKYFNKNIFLMTHKATRKIYDKWLETKPTIQVYFAEDKIKEAKELAKPFIFHPKCRKEMEEMDMNKSLFGSLLDHIKSRNFEIAYDLCEREPSLKNSIYYDKLEAYWLQIYEKAKRLLSVEPVLNRQKAKDILKPFLAVPTKKELAAQIINNAGIFRRAKKMVFEKNFSGYYKLLDQYPYLENDELHKKVEYISTQLKQRLTTEINDENFSEALQTISMLKQFSSSIIFADKKENLIKSVLLLGVQLDKKNLSKACQTVDENKLGYSQLSAVRRYHKMVEKFITLVEDKIKKADESAFTTIDSLEDNMESLKIKRKLIKKLYMHQIGHAIEHKKQQVNWEETIRTYLLYFPADEALIKILKDATLDHILTELKVDYETQKPAFESSIIKS